MPASAPAVPLRPGAAPLPRGLDRVVVSTELAAVRAAWEQLLAVAPASAYQTPAWLEPWLATLGYDLRPAFVLGSDAAGPVALLPLGLSRRGGLRVARFLGGRDANYGLGLFHPDVAWDGTLLGQLLDRAARDAGIDLFWLANQPDALSGHANPLARLPRQPSPSLQHETPLPADPEILLARTLSARGRKRLRQKEAKLAALGAVQHEVATTHADADRIAAALLAQRAARFGRAKDDDLQHRFLVAAGTPMGARRPAVELHALSCGGTIVSAFAGTEHAGRVSGMLISFSEEARWARYSPGEVLLARVVAAKCREGAGTFDLGIGESRYKQSFCPVAVPLFDTILGMSLRGRLAAAVVRAALAAKRGIKQSPRLWPAVNRLRSALHRLSGGLAPGGG